MVERAKEVFSSGLHLLSFFTSDFLLQQVSASELLMVIFALICTCRKGYLKHTLKTHFMPRSVCTRRILALKCLSVLDGGTAKSAVQNKGLVTPCYSKNWTDSYYYSSLEHFKIEFQSQLGR